MRQLLWALGALVLSGCASRQALPLLEMPAGAPPVASKVPEPTYEVRTMELSGTMGLTYGRAFLRSPCLGLHTRMGTHSKLQLDSELESDWARAKVVAAHEMGHAFGLDHYEDLDCWMYHTCPKTRVPQPVVPCTQELMKARRLTEGKIWKLKIKNSGFPTIEHAAVAAANAWNHALGRKVVVVE